MNNSNSNNNRLRLFWITVGFVLIAVNLFSLSFILISGYLFDSIFTKTFGIAIIWGVIILYLKVIPYKVSNTAWKIILLFLIIMTIFCYTYNFPNGYLEP